MVAGRVREIYDRDAEDRQKEAGKFHGRGKEKVVPTTAQPNRPSGAARDTAGSTVGVGGRTVDRATKLNAGGVAAITGR